MIVQLVQADYRNRPLGLCRSHGHAEDHLQYRHSAPAGNIASCIIGVAVALATVGALADDRPVEVRRGEQAAGIHCSACHRALGDEQSMMKSGAIAFQDLAMDSKRTVESMRAFMSQDHPFMPFDELDAQKREDILAYIFWLRPRP